LAQLTAFAITCLFYFDLGLTVSVLCPGNSLTSNCVKDIVISLNGKSYNSPRRLVRNVIPFYKSHSVAINQIGWVDYTTFPREPGMRIQRLWMSGGQFSQFEIWKDDRRVVNEDVDDNAFMQAREGLKPINGVFTYDPIQRGWVANDTLVPTAEREFKFRFNMQDTNQVRMLVEGYRVLSDKAAHR